MNRIRSVKFLLVCCVAVMMVQTISTPLGQSERTIRVNADSSTIQEAINNANPGDTIRVSPGTYFEHVMVNKTVSLTGEDSDTTVIDGTNSGTIIQVTAHNVVITGFKLQNSGYGWTMHGVYVYKADNCTIQGNTLYNVCHSVRLNYTRNSQVLNNTVNGPTNGVTMYGIRLENCVNCTATGNNVTVLVGAVHLENATNCTVKGNLLTNNDQGIRLYSPCTQNLIVENTVRNNQYDGMIALMPENTTFMGNRIFHNNFINNTNPFIIQASGTVWDNGVEGNYWTRYQGTDLARDGIGDEPYTFGAERDNHPLMGAFTSFNVSNSLSVNVVSDSDVENFDYIDFNRTIKMQISNATADQTSGFCRTTIPHGLINEPYTVTVDGAAPLFVNYTLYDDGNTRWIYFTYSFSKHEVVIVPEFPSIPTQVMLATAITISLISAEFSRKRKHGPQESC